MKKHIHNDDVDDIVDDDEETLRCDETNLQLYQRNRTNNQNWPKIICFECHKQNIQVEKSE